MADLDALLAELGFEGNELVATSPGFAEQLVRFLTNPLIAGLLLLGGFLLIIGDFFSGGLGLAAIGGVALLAIFFWGHLLAGPAGWEDIVLMLVGVALLAVEVFVVPGFGVAGVLGLLALGGGAFMAMIYRDFDVVTTGDLWRAGLTVGGAVVASVVGLAMLLTAISRRSGSSRPGGIAVIDGRRIDVVTSGEYLPAGEPIEVIRDDRYRRVVRKLP